jgi:hypothetical protein
MNYIENLNKVTNNLRTFIGEKISINDFSIDEVIFSKRVRTPSGPVVKIIKKTTFKFLIEGIKNNPVVNGQSFIYELKKCLEDTFQFKFKRINVGYIDQDILEITA